MSVITQALRSLRRDPLGVGRKAWNRLAVGKAGQEEALRWCRGNADDLQAFGLARNATLWAESDTFCGSFLDEGLRMLAKSQRHAGGGAAIRLLYFITRLRKPRVIVETGVSAGWSSAVFLEALHQNGNGGQLFSSDLAPLRDDNTEIGLLVAHEMRENWTLLVEGDRRNLPKIMAQLPGPIDFFHYDSDKSTSGREFAFHIVRPYLAPDAAVIFDDINDNQHFRDLLQRVEGRSFIFEVGTNFKKHVGLILLG